MSRKPSRVAFIASSSAAFASIAFIKSPAKAADFTGKAGTNQAVDHPLSVAMKDLWDNVRKESNGRIDVSVFPNNQLGGDTAMLTQLRSGALQIMTLDGAILASVVPVAAIPSIGFAFQDSNQAFKAVDGRLGAYIRNDIASKGLYAFEIIWENGMRNVTSSTHPINTADDFSGFKIRTPPGNLYIELFKALGASPTPINFSELYPALQTKIVDGQENPLLNIEFARMYEVQKYLSLTAHMWGAYWLLANGDFWASLPPDLKTIVSRNARFYGLRMRKEVVAMNDGLLSKLKGQGMTVNTPERSGMRAKLGDFYHRWKAEFGTTAWDILESYSGKLG
jgi:tripartite ATP-independent transporter DctP family solute receptor